ncbi:hypothetical protein LOK49_LG08G01831 [Camellia lanceoleosa]|uniref:Uncharacterized protein n=1 Tax=Camellia lanceoleosa TaxID=1840588 RepID=A0ACC0GV17_9ERIC|nr:hypothetical protein LOK49_LG08G01831 [Camellia lanceoleosa]
MVAVVRLVAVVEVEEIGVCEGIAIVVVDQEMLVMENKCLLYEKKDLLPTLHFSGLRSLHCINKRSLLCFSLVEGIHSVNDTTTVSGVCIMEIL